MKLRVTGQPFWKPSPLLGFEGLQHHTSPKTRKRHAVLRDQETKE